MWVKARRALARWTEPPVGADAPRSEPDAAREREREERERAEEAARQDQEHAAAVARMVAGYMAGEAWGSGSGEAGPPNRLGGAEKSSGFWDRLRGR